jgi:uncharacterized protein (DUF362 family)
VNAFFGRIKENVLIKSCVAITRYEKPVESVRKVVELCSGMDHLPRFANVFIKPNIAFWSRSVQIPQWGVVTTSRVVEDMVVLLKEKGIERITIGEGMVIMDTKDTGLPAHAFRALGYETLKQRYGVNIVNLWDRPFQKTDIGDGLFLNYSTDILNSDFVVNLPVLKTHNQTVVSLGIKNLKGTIDLASRKKCHSMDPAVDLNVMIARLAAPLPPMLTLIDGIFTNERGPGFDGKIRRSDLLIASSDVLAADMVGASVLGHSPCDVPHLVHAAARTGVPADLSTISIQGESLDAVASRHEYDFHYTDTPKNSLPMPLAGMGIQGISYRKYDLSMCTYCAGINGLVLSAIRHAWKGRPWGDVEILTGKSMKPTPGMKKTILLGKCIYKANKDHPDIHEMIPVKGCPPNLADIVKALHRAGIDVDPGFFVSIDQLPGFFMSRYAGRPEYDESLFKIA